MNNVRAVFLDRDGILNELRPDPTTGELESPLAVSDVVLLPDAAAAVHRLHEAGYLLIGITNQPAAAKGVISLQEQDAIHQRVLDLLDAERAQLDGWRICPHHPSGTVVELTMTCDCRKPAPGMLLDAAKEFDINLTSSWMVGDSNGDIEAGIAAGTRTVLVGAADDHKRRPPNQADIYTLTVAGAVDAILTARSR